MQRGDIFKVKDKEVFYQIAGRWGVDYVLMPMTDNDEQVLIYSPGDLEELISTGQLGKLHNTGVKIKTKD